MANIYLKVTTETFSKLRFSGFKKFVTRSVFGELQFTKISLNFKTSCRKLKIRGLGAKLCVRLFYYFNFERNYDVLKSKSPCILWNKNIKTKRNRKWKIPHTVLERWTLCLSSYNNRKFKVKQCDELELAKEKRGHFLYCWFCPKGMLLSFVFYLNV